MEEQLNGFRRSMLRQELPFVGTALLVLAPFLYGSLGWNGQFWALLLFSGFLLFLSAIDIRHGMIFNRFLLPMACIGLLLDLAEIQTNLLNGCLACIMGGALLFLVRWGSNSGMGGGDVKLGMVLGIWLGCQNLLIALFLAFLSGTAVGILLMLRYHTTKLRIPFGPFLSLGAWLSALYGEQFLLYYEAML